jgi:hypothetical protein
MKSNFLIIIFLFFYLNSVSQEKKINFDISFGTSLSIPKTSNLSNSNGEGSPTLKSSTAIGFYVLPNLNYLLNEKKSIDFGIGFSMDCYAVENSIGPITDKGKRTIHQIQVPISYNYKFGKNNSYQVGMGGFANTILLANEKGVSESMSIPGGGLNDDPTFDEIIYTNYKYDLKDYYNRISFGTFVQLKKLISLSENKNGFISIKFNQHLNLIKDTSEKSSLSSYETQNEKQPTLIYIGFGVNF